MIFELGVLLTSYHRIFSQLFNLHYTTPSSLASLLHEIIGVPEQALGWLMIPLGLMEAEPSELS